MYSQMITYLQKLYPALAPELKYAGKCLDHDHSEISLVNQDKVLRALWAHKVSSDDLWGSTGYGYNDLSREKLESVYSQVFGAEAALVRPQIVSGTHAIWLALSGNLVPGDHVLSVTGIPYPTLNSVLSQTGPSSLASHNIAFESVELSDEGSLDLNAIAKRITPRTKIVYIQKSRGYSLRKPLSCAAIEAFCRWLTAHFTPRPIILVDNCYGEFVEATEPCQGQADIVAGSLIKNPGGGLADTGGYIVGRAHLVANTAERLLAPGITEIGPTGNSLRAIFQGLFMAPHFVGQALTNARFASALAEALDYCTYPRWNESRCDLVQAILLQNKEEMAAFCQAIQQRSPVDSYLIPVPGKVPGYLSLVLMAAGTFVQGASLELTADGPIQPPYAVYLQGGLGLEHGFLAIAHAFAALKNI